MKPFYFIYFLCGILATVALASEEEPAVSVDFRVFLWPSEVPIALVQGDAPPIERRPRLDLEELYVAPEVAYFTQGEGGPVDLELAEGVLSEVYSYRGGVDLQFVRKRPMSADGEARFERLGAVKLSPSMSDVVLLFFEKSKGRYEILAWPIESSDAAAGHRALLWNLSTQPLLCALGEKKFQLEVGQRHATDVAAAKDFYQMMLVASQDDNGRLRRRVAELLVMSEDRPHIIVIYNRADRKQSFNLMKLDLSAPSNSEKLPNSVQPPK